MKHLSVKPFVLGLAFISLAVAVTTAVHTSLAPWGYIVSVAAIFLSMLAAFQGISQRLSESTRCLRRISELSQKNVSINSAIEVDAALALRQRFPGIQIPTSSYSMRFANLLALADVLDAKQPKKVVEFGSGISTLIVSAWMRDRGCGEIISIDHDREWVSLTCRHLVRMGLEDHAKVISSPLREREGDGDCVSWYSASKDVLGAEQIDLVIVDGPPRSSSSSGRGRMPALAFVAPSLAEDAVVVLDDANRPGEQEVIASWQSLIPEFSVRMVPTMTGLCVMERKGEIKANARIDPKVGQPSSPAAPEVDAPV